MQPLSLKIKDFCSHSETEFSFKDFSSALIIGKVKNNDRFSNGAGKSTIFNAIEYVLFNEIHFSSLEKIIRDGCDVCRVEIQFLSSVDNCVYKIIRSNSRKTGTDVRLFKNNNENWEDLTQRRISDTEKEIIKIIGFNYKAFCASVLFNQSGSENNIQKDFGNLPFLTPEKRKSVLREVLQLNVYSSYEKIAKTKLSVVQSEIERDKIILTTVGDPDLLIIKLSEEYLAITDEIQNLNVLLDKLKFDLNDKKNQLLVLKNKYKSDKENLSGLFNKKTNIESSIEGQRKKIKLVKQNMANLAADAKAIQDNLELNKNKIKLLNDNKDDASKISLEKDILIEKCISKRHLISKIEKDIKHLNEPISEDKICKSCHQSVSEEHKHSWSVNSSENIKTLSIEKINIQEELSKLEIEQNNINNKYIQARNNEQLFNDLNNKNAYLEKDLISKRTLYKDYISLNEENSSSIELNLLELNNIIKSIEDIKSRENVKEENLIVSLENDINAVSSNESKINYSMNNLIGKQAILDHKKSQCELDKLKIQEIKQNILSNEQKLLVYSKVSQAFGSNGIPALIINNVLDELQNEANNWLSRLRPGLQLQFIVINDNNKKKEQEDTLDILYFIDGAQREYKQLSGAQKIIVSLAIKLSLLFIMNKRLGVNIKLMLLDEVDQALDPGSTEIFAQIIRVIQEEIKVMIITHDDDLKNKFSHAILVEQNEKNVSFGKLINW